MSPPLLSTSLFLLACQPTGPSADGDGDGFTEEQGDCDDSDPEVYPGSHSVEVPGDGVDQDCDGADLCRDLNCDGRPDLVFANFQGNQKSAVPSYVYWGQDDGFSSSERLDLPTIGAQDVAVEDLDGDGYLEIVFANYGEQCDITPSYLYWGGAEGYSMDDRQELETNCAAGVNIRDVDSDGHPDILFSNNGGPDDYDIDSYLYWGSEGGFSADARTGLPTSGAWGNEIADLDADGYLDVIFSNACEASQHNFASCIYWGSATGPDSEVYSALYTERPVDVTAADLDADGFLDLVFSGNRSGESNAIDSYIYYGGEEGFTEEARSALPTVGAMGNSVVDLDMDGHLDIIFSSFTDGDTQLLDSLIYWGSEAGFSEQSRSGLPTQGSWANAAADLNGDGWPDIVFSNTTSGTSTEVDSWIYWGSAEGFSEGDRSALPTLGGSGVVIVGAL